MSEFVQYCLLILNKDTTGSHLWLNVFSSYYLNEMNFFRGYVKRHIHKTSLQKTEVWLVHSFFLFVPMCQCGINLFYSTLLLHSWHSFFPFNFLKIFLNKDMCILASHWKIEKMSKNLPLFSRGSQLTEGDQTEKHPTKSPHHLTLHYCWACS